MSGAPANTRYDLELQKLGDTYKFALAADIDGVKRALAGASEASIIGIGSGGSFTAASLLCSFHEAYTGRVSRPSTPLEIICQPALASASPVFLISAEGKNPDIIEALRRARKHSARSINIITNQIKSLLVDAANELTDIGVHSFDNQIKDGYLATNSLMLNSVIIARAYCELDTGETLPPTIDGLTLDKRAIDSWFDEVATFAAQSASSGNLIIVYSPPFKSIAVDLESKLSEAALTHCQIADLRSFAHGRHLWLSTRGDRCAVLAIVDPHLDELWKKMQGLFPKTIPVATLPLAGTRPVDVLTGMVAGMRLISAIARGMGADPGKPEVPQFGRDLYYLDLAPLIPAPPETAQADYFSKREALAARWPSPRKQPSMLRTLRIFAESFEQQRFRAIVFDYDGTLCVSGRTNEPPPSPIIDRIKELIDGGIIVGIVSGRGGSVQDLLRERLPHSYWSKLQLGLYSGGLICDVASVSPQSKETSEFLSHAARIVNRLIAVGAPIEKIRVNNPYQISVRLREGVRAENMWFVIADALRQAGIDLSSVVRSKHSVDILAPGISKSLLIAHLIQKFNVDPYEVLAIGDLGAWPGNDFALLEHQYSLSVDIPSRRLDRGWKLAPRHKRDVDATLWYLERITVHSDQYFSIQLREPA